ncbi:hypothetical protein BK816_08790 [Boudabousia tangfeifanii]|uniref:Uncharacterized protein n=1 Tax=Boudabousia tangfeifanii TaxID=1912795 RepID=A0A1D9MM35_9ACTO|nr:hypothetical protein [Boudabousia tangfeifanii]AOZ73354.1 hypothetical protein BK816_08790 [Boudabousia tangfeifanii]
MVKPPRRSWLDGLKAIGQQLPVNKPYSNRPNEKEVPEVKNPLLLGALGLGSAACAGVYRMIAKKPQEVKPNVENDDLAKAIAGLEPVSKAQVKLQKAMASRRLWVRADLNTSHAGTVQQVGLEVLRLAWDSALGGVSAVDMELSLPDGRIIDGTDLGFENDIAYPHELFARFGPTSADPEWRP